MPRRRKRMINRAQRRPAICRWRRPRRCHRPPMHPPVRMTLQACPPAMRPLPIRRGPTSSLPAPTSPASSRWGSETIALDRSQILATGLTNADDVLQTIPQVQEQSQCGRFGAGLPAGRHRRLWRQFHARHGDQPARAGHRRHADVGRRTPRGAKRCGRDLYRGDPGADRRHRPGSRSSATAIRRSMARTRSRA